MKTSFETFMYEYINTNVIDLKLQEMLTYSIKSGGKRFRPLLFLSLFDDNEYKNYFHIAASIEFCHNYSLVHDDLPCMDNDKYRRGNLSCWAKYGQGQALLVGDALASESLLLILKANLNSDILVKLAQEFILKSGVNGMILGQHLDINHVASNPSEIKYMYGHKTAKLIELCFSSYAIIKGLNKDKYTKLGYYLGILFQYQDDYLEINASSDERNDADLRNTKDTVLTIFQDYDVETKKIKTAIKELIKELDINDKTQQILNKIISRDERIENVK